MFTTVPHPLTAALKQHDSQISGDLTEPVPCGVPWTWLIIGGRGTGKTSLLLSWLQTMRSHYDTITLFSKTARNDSETKRPLKSLIQELESDGRFYATLTEPDAVETMDRIQEFNAAFDARRATGDKKKRKRQPRHLVILDDQLANLPKGRFKSPINDLVVNQRHMKISLVVLTQAYRSIPTIWRANAQLISFFPTASAKEYAALEEDLSLEADRLRRVYDYCCANATSEQGNGRPFLHINLFDAARPVFYKRFDRIRE